MRTIRSVGRRRRRFVALSVATLLWTTVGLSDEAHASMSGPCTAQVKGQDVAALSASDPGDAIDVEESDVVTVAAQSSSAIGSYKIQLEYAGIRWTVAKGQATNNQWSRQVNVDDYARYGAGLYRVHGVSDGASPCDGSVLIKVGGNPLTTPLGIAGVAFVAIGIINAIANLRARREVPA
jgi:hypothetical protein